MSRSRIVRIGAAAALAATALAAVAQDGRPAVYVIPIIGEINPARVVFVRRGIEAATEHGADTIIFEIDTFGGRVDSALQITTLIGTAEADTVAYVPVTAEGTGVSWSAGALISLACDAIVMAPGTSIGAAAPVYQTQTGMAVAEEKTISAVRTQMAALAEKNDYPVAVALAMVDADVELLEIRVGDELFPVARSEIADYERLAAERGAVLTEGKVISASGKLLALTAGEMERYGISSGTESDLAALVARLGLSDRELIRLEESFADRAAAFVTGAAVSGILILCGLVAIYLEITTPGFGIPGTVAIVCFAVVFLGSALLGTVGSLELLLFLAGVILLVVEIFLIPGFGFTGISGLVLIAIALVFSRQYFVWPEFEWEWDLFRRNISIVGISIVSSLVTFGVVLKAFPRLPLFSRLILSDSDGETGSAATAVGSPLSLSSAERGRPPATSVGSTGVVVNALRPIGKAQIDDEIFEVASDGEFVESGIEIVVVAAKGNRLIVRRRDEP